MAAAKSQRAKSALHTAQPAGSLLGGLLSLVVGVLLVVRMLLPTESAEDGGTLWIVQLWLAAGLLWAWNAIRERDDRIRWDRLDVAFWVVVIAHIVSAAAVLLNGGQKRAAINLSWEWVGLGVCFFLVRQTVRSGFAARRLVGIMVAVSVSLAALGVWQHYVSFPATRTQYQQKTVELKRLVELPAATSRVEELHRLRHRRELKIWMLEAGVPQDPTALALFEERLKSSEPFGMFALANTFAGLLLVWFMAALGTLASVWQGRPHWTKRLVLTVAAGLIAYCLILTKSRTAWVGLLAGLTVWGAYRFWRSDGKPARWITYAATGCLVLLVLLAIAAFSGGFDLAVITEAPKSLSYRLQYWSGSWKVLCEQPLLGTGPGNFRHHYLRYKLPASSEEIADPHNFVLDLWANGGLIAVVGLFVFLFFAIRRLKSTSGEVGDSPPVSRTITGSVAGGRLWNALAIGSGLAFATAFAVTVLAGDGYDLRLPALMLGFLASFVVYGRVSNSSGASNVCLIAAVVGLMTHLLGAGGMEMPAIVQTLLVLVAASAVWCEADSVETESVARRPRKTLFVGGLFGVLFVACLLSATAPVLNRRALVAAADGVVAGGAGAAKAARLYHEAAAADPFSPVPSRRLAQLYFARWSALPGDSSREFERAVGFQEMAIAFDPHNPNSFHTLGRWHRERHRRTANDADLAAAIQAFRQAAARYPHNAAIRADLALALAAAGNSSDAAAEAGAALEQNAINDRAGHRDKILDSRIIEALQKLSNPPRGVTGRGGRN